MWRALHRVRHNIDDVMVKINGKQVYLWRAADQVKEAGVATPLIRHIASSAILIAESMLAA